MYPSTAVNSVILTTEEKRSLKVDYFITTGVCQTDGSDQNVVYGVMAKLSIDEQTLECSQIDDVSPSEETVKKLISLLAQYGVTPVTLKDVVEDFVAAEYEIKI